MKITPNKFFVKKFGDSWALFIPWGLSITSSPVVFRNFNDILPWCRQHGLTK